MTSEIENPLAALITEIGQLQADLANFRGPQERLATMKQIVEELRKRTISKATTEDHFNNVDTALRESRQLFRSVLENNPGIIYAKRKDGRYMYVNHEWERVIDFNRELVIGRTDQELFPAGFANRIRTNDLAVLEAGRLIEYEEEIATPWGKQLYLSKKVPLTSASGEVEGICCISTNITDQRRNELALRETISTLERERENKLLNVDVIIASIGHELKQPLTWITANASAARRFAEMAQPDLDKVRNLLNMIADQGIRAGEIFDGVRSLFGKFDQGRQPVDINEIIHEILRSMSVEFAEHGVTVYTDLATELPNVEAHKGQLQEVIINLVRNAIEAMTATADGKRMLRTQTQLRNNDRLYVAIEDSGPGIDPTRLNEIFKLSSRQSRGGWD
jgi:PAS domain S-box-containing protein